MPEILARRLMNILCFVDCASRYIRIMKTNLIHHLSSVYFVNQQIISYSHAGVR